MTHPDAKFEKMTRSNTPLYGSRKLLLCGFSGKAQEKFLAMLKMAGLADLDTVWASKTRAEETVGGLMTLARKTGMKQTLWAVLTPTSETWPLGRLLEELAAERQAMKKSNR
jgi:hypothetical protein